MINFIISLKHPIERKGLRYIIESAFKNTNVLEANTPNAILKLLKKNKVDLFICDIFQGEGLRIEWIQQLSTTYPALPILIFSGHSEEIYGVRLIKAGASGCISNICEPEVLVKAIKTLLEGNKYITSTIAELMADHLIRKNKLHHELLSAREFEVFIHIAKGKKYAEIAKLLFVSPNTVSTYRSRIMEKMNFKTNYDLINYSMINKLV